MIPCAGRPFSSTSFRYMLSTLAGWMSHSSITKAVPCIGFRPWMRSEAIFPCGIAALERVEAVLACYCFSNGVFSSCNGVAESPSIADISQAYQGPRSSQKAMRNGSTPAYLSSANFKLATTHNKLSNQPRPKSTHTFTCLRRARYASWVSVACGRYMWRSFRLHERETTSK